MTAACRIPRVGLGLALTLAAATVSVSPAVQASAEPGPGPARAHSPRDIAGPDWNPPARPRHLSGTDHWPAAQTVLSRLTAYGIAPVLIPGYDDPVYERNAHLDGTGTPVSAVVMHDTGTSIPAPLLRPDHSLNYIVKGVRNSSHQVVRACQLYVDRNGAVYVIYLRRTWHAGRGDAMFGVPTSKMNGYSYGIEIESQGDSVQDLTAPQISMASKIAAALLDVAQLPTERAINHKDYAGRLQGKVDTAYDIGIWRSLINTERAAVGSPFAGPVTPIPVPSTSPALPAPQPTAPPAPQLRSGEVSLSQLRYGQKNESVSRYQASLRNLARKQRLTVKRLNPNGVTGFYGTETKRLTAAVLAKLARFNSSWRAIPATAPTRRLVNKAGLHTVP